jgi:ACS family tartrate transporter-like MFS transporter
MSAALSTGLTVAEDIALLRSSALRKNTWRLVPLLVFALVFNYIDRTSVGFAALTMNQDLGLTATQFGWGAGLLFVGYCGFEVPSSLIQYRVGARRWLGRIMVTWGLAAAATAFAAGPSSFYVIRFILGIAEAGFFPGAMFFLSCWFPAEHRTRVLGWLGLSVPVSSVIGAPLSGILLQMQGVAGLRGWQWMFILEGLPVCLVGIATLFLLADHPQQASWLTQPEKDELTAMLSEERREREHTQFWAAIKDRRVLILAGITFAFTLGAYGISIWLPLILKGHGLSNVAIGFVAAIPYVATTIVMIGWMAVISRRGGKIWSLVAACALGAIGLGLSVLSGSLVTSMAAITIAVVGAVCARTIFWTIPVRFLTGPAAAGGLAFINSIGALGGFVGPFMVGWLKDVTGSFAAGLLGMTVVLSISVALSLSLFLMVKAE